MQIYRYWARVCCDESGTPQRQGSVIAIGWSQHSQAQAEQHALERARQIAASLRDQRPLNEHQWYYPDRPIREPVLDELQVDGQVLAVITRNIYGSCVLNAARAMFIDIDRPQPPSVGLVGRLMGRRPPAVEDDTPDRVANVVQRHPGLGLRLYETAAGYRGLVTSMPCDPTDARTLQLLDDFGADRLYVQLCQAQECFRARLTPKPWRCGMPLPPKAWPWIDDARARAFEKWSQQYDRAISGFAVCRHVATLGPEAVHPDIAPVLQLHDEMTCTAAPRLA